MLVIGVAVYTVCWCGFFGRKQDGKDGVRETKTKRDTGSRRRE